MLNVQYWADLHAVTAIAAAVPAVIAEEYLKAFQTRMLGTDPAFHMCISLVS